jgi:coproporphyrinogen III oxidase-like Fe-S oxidoreductase
VEHLASVEQYQPRRIFLADGDAFVLPTKQLVRILHLLHAKFPEVERISIYASAVNVKRKPDVELRAIREAGLELVYIGLESGDDEVLRRVNKGATNQDNIDACLRLKASNFTVSSIIILGLGGRTRSQAHAQHTAATINAIDPPYLAALTLMLVPGTKLHAEACQGTFQPLNPLETLQELRLLIDNLTDLTNCLFRTNHASNYLPLRGVLSRDRPRLLAAIDAVLADPAAATRLRPEGMRGL